MSKYSVLIWRIEADPGFNDFQELAYEAADALRELEALLDEYKDAERRARKAEGEALADRDRLEGLIKDAVEWADRHAKEPWWLEAFRAALEGKGG